jgi:hypothetical protein
MPEDELEPWLGEAAEQYHPPLPTPREAMWRAIDQQRGPARRAGAGRQGWSAPVRHRWLPLAAAAGLLLAAGVGIGRLTRSPGPEVAVPTVGRSAPPSPAEVNATAYRLATLEHLSQSEEFLTLFRSSLGRSDARLASAGARRLLGTNRLLLDSPAALDRRTRLLLEDLELVLAGIAQLPEHTRPQDVDLITEGMEQGQVMPRLRTAVPAGAASRQGAL